MQDFWKPGTYFISRETSVDLKQQTKWRLGKVWSCEFFPFLCPTEMGHSQIWSRLLDYRWKTGKIMRLWKYFAVQESSFLRLFRKHLSSQKSHRVGQIYFIEGFILQSTSVSHYLGKILRQCMEEWTYNEGWKWPLREVSKRTSN